MHNGDGKPTLQRRVRSTQSAAHHGIGSPITASISLIHAASKATQHKRSVAFLFHPSSLRTRRSQHRAKLLGNSNVSANVLLWWAITADGQPKGNTLMATDRLRGRALQTLRKRLLSENPLCVVCASKGRVSIATQLDHIHAIVKGGDARPDDDGYQGLCDDCHAAKTRTDMGLKQRAQFDQRARVVW